MEEILKKLEVDQKKYWNIPREAGEFIYGKILDLKPKIIVEIGTSTGYSGLWMIKGLKDSGVETEMEKGNGGGKLITVESSPERFEMARKNFEDAGVTPFVVQLRGHAPEVFEENLELLKNGVDLLFLDATKAEYLKFLKYFESHLRPGALIIADNVISHGDAMRDFLQYVADPNLNGGKFKGEILAQVGTGLWVGEKL